MRLNVITAIAINIIIPIIDITSPAIPNLDFDFLIEIMPKYNAYYPRS